MKVLVIGKGGREHALVWTLARGAGVEIVYCAPGNPGMKEAVCIPQESPGALAEFAIREGVDLTVVGPEAPLCAGIVDEFRVRGLRIFGPDKQAARLEGSKSYAKQFMRRYGIPTAEAQSFTEAKAACEYITERGAPIVVKADGLAAGKGVTVAASVEEARRAVRETFDGVFGAAGSEVLVEECLEGEEASILAFVDGETVVPLASSQDHKRALDGDCGPNTGGMGAYSPAPVVDDDCWKRVRTEVLDPFLRGCRAEGLDYRGVIYAGIMVGTDGIKVLEFNVRFGDPETQVVLPRLNGDLAEIMTAVVDRRLASVSFGWHSEAAVCVVMASGGYPGEYVKGHVVDGLDEAEATGAVVFHAGTSRNERGNIVTDGGRVLGVTALGGGIGEAVEASYRAVRCVSWPGVQFRTDIASRALDTEP